jgi:RES domain-containing protein
VELSNVVAALDLLSATTFEGETYRHVSVGRPALSGEGARLVGGRWNPPGSFAVLYLALDIPTAIAEFARLATKQGRAGEDFLPRDLFTYETRLQHVVDLRISDNANAVHLDATSIAADDLTACQLVGEAAHHAGFEGVLAPSATGSGDALAIFLDRLLPDSVVKDVAVARWNEIPPLSDTSTLRIERPD